MTTESDTEKEGLPVDGAGLFSNQDLKQTIYDHGGCRIYFERGRKRQLIADGYQDEDFAKALMAFVEGYVENAKAESHQTDTDHEKH